MRINTLLSVVIAVGLVACSKDTETDARASIAGRRVLLTPPSGRFVEYTGTELVSSDQSVWVAAIYDARAGNTLVAHLDTLGQPLGGRAIFFPTTNSAGALDITALSDGSALALGIESSQPLVVRLGADGSISWSNRVTSALANTGLVFHKLATQAGGEALVCGKLEMNSASGKQVYDIFGKISGTGPGPVCTGYALPHTSSSNLPMLEPLPNGQGAAFLLQTGTNEFAVAAINASGQLLWLRQVTLDGLPAAPAAVRYDLAVSPSGNIAFSVVPIGVNSGDTFQLVRLSPTGNLLSAVNYTTPAYPKPQVGKLAIGAQEEISWTAESTQALYYYTVDAQDNIELATTLALAPVFGSGITLNSYGIVRKTPRHAYAFGTFAGPMPGNEQGVSLNYYAINPVGQAGCQLANAPAITKTAVPGTRSVALAVPAAVTLPVAVASYPLTSNPLALTASTACQ